jgi:hypothetical protein
MWKMVLTWRMYTRHTLASLETTIFFFVFSIWLIFSSFFLYNLAQWEMGIPDTPHALVFAGIYSMIFVLWVLMAFAGYRLNEGYDLERLRLYPISFNSVFTAGIFGPFADMSIILPLSGTLAVFLAIGPYPFQLPIGILLVLAMVFFTVTTGTLLVNLLYVFLPRLNLIWVGGAVLVLTLAWAILLNLGMVRYPLHSFFLLFRPEGLEFFRLYPPGQIGIAITSYLDRDYMSMVKPLLAFTGWTAGVLALNYILTLYLWTSDVASKSSGRAIRTNDWVSRALNALGRFLERFLGQQSVAMFKKDMLELSLRSPYFFFYKAVPGSVAPMIILLAMRWNLSNIVRFSDMTDAAQRVTFATLALVIFITVAQGNLYAGNMFGLEDISIKSLMVMPTPRRHFLIGKNMFLGSLYLIDALVLACLVPLYYPSVYTFFSWFTLLVTMYLLILSLGNFTSAIWPYWMPLDKPSFTLRSTMILSLVNSIATLLLGFLFAPALAAVVLPRVYHLTWLSYVMMPIVVAYGVLVYYMSLKPAVALLEANEFLVLARIADREEM